MASLPKTYFDYVEDLNLQSPELYAAKSGATRNPYKTWRTPNPLVSQKGSARPGYNSSEKLGSTGFVGTVQDVEMGIVPLTDEASRSQGGPVTSSENPRRSRGAGMARNPQESSAALYETFHQKAPERIDEYEEHVHYHGWLAELGEMREIKVDLVYMDPPKQATIEFEPGTKLGCSEDGRQLYLVGGDQSLDLKALGFNRDWVRDYMLIGVLSELTYRTKKGFDKFEVIDYYHEVGEDTGDLPIVAYDNMNQQLMIVGGKYRVEHDGIIN